MATPASVIAAAAAPPTPGRPSIIGPASGPEPPFPLRMEGRVISGFGRGSKELGIPTANLPVDASATPWISDFKSGVYFGWASLQLPASPATPSTTTNNGFTVYPMVMSIGYNPFYRNTVRSAEVHVLHSFAADFYGAPMRLLIAGFIREEKDYAGLEALIADINFDCEVARASVARPAWTPRELFSGSSSNSSSSSADPSKDGQEGGTLDGAWLLRPWSEKAQETTAPATGGDGTA